MSVINDQTWIEAYLRQSELCGDCGESDLALNAHHLLRRADGGSDALGNIVLLCDDCHYASHNFGHYGDPLQTFLEDYPYSGG